MWAHLEELVDEWEQRYFSVVSLVILRIEFQEISKALWAGLFQEGGEGGQPISAANVADTFHQSGDLHGGPP